MLTTADSKPLILIAAWFGMFPLALFLLSLTAPIFLFAELIVSFRIQIGLTMVVFALLMTCLGARWLAVIYSAATIWCLFPALLSYIPTGQPLPGSVPIKISTFNVYHSNQRYASELQNIKDMDADILLITEYTDAWAGRLADLEPLYDYRILEPLSHGFGIALFSKLPLEDTETLNFKTTPRGTDVLAIKATVVVDSQRLQLIGIHTMSPSLEDSQRLAQRNGQILQAASHAADASKPVVLLGDFNCVPWSSYMKPVYQVGLRDSRRGFGFQASWHRLMKPLQIPIDHIFVSDRIHVHDRRMGRSVGSDHFPVLATISIGRPE